MIRRIKIIIDYSHRIEPDCKTNWVTDGLFLEDTIGDMLDGQRDILVIQP